MQWSAVFDWDGVLVNSSRLHERSWDLLAAETGRVLPPGHFQKGFGRKNEQIIPEILEWTTNDLEIAAIAVRKEEIYRSLVRAEGLPLLPGAREWLDELKRQGVTCVIGSSTERRNIDLVLAAHGIGDYFDSIVSGDDVREGKPHPGIFLTAASRIEADPSSCVVFEDARVGIQAARAAGMRVIAVTTTLPRTSLRDVDLVVDRLDELSVETAGPVRLVR